MVRAAPVPGRARARDPIAAAGTGVAPARRRMHSGPWKVDGPRERMLASGPAALSDAELLALVLGTGTGRLSARAAALALAEQAPLPELAWAHPGMLAIHPGVGPARAAAIATSPEPDAKSRTLLPRTISGWSSA